MSLSLLEPFQATLDGEPATGFPSNKVRAVRDEMAFAGDWADGQTLGDEPSVGSDYCHSPPFCSILESGNHHVPIRGCSMSENPQMERILAVKAKYERTLLRKKNVVGLGVGYRERDGEITDQMVLTVMVQQKEQRSRLRSSDLIPPELDGVPVDVKEVGRLQAL